MNKAETAAKHGADQVKIWRRSYATPPPALADDDERFPGKVQTTTVLQADCLLHYAASLTRDVLARVWQDPRYKDLEDENIPRAESLKLTVARFLPAWFVRMFACDRPPRHA